VQDGIFNPDKMIDLLQAETDKALAEGYAALRVTGEMTWALRDLPGSERLIEYETKLNFFFPNSKALAICQYDMNQFDPELLLNVLRTHPIAVIGTEIYKNFYYIPPKELSKDTEPSITLQYWIDNLIERKEIEMKYQQTYNQSEFYRDLLSHDINNILQVILSTAERVEIEKNLEVIESAVSSIKKQIERGSSLISTIHKISQLESSKVTLESIDAMELLNKAIKSIIGSFRSRKVKIEIECILKNLYVQANSILLDVLENLLHNAVKHNQSSTAEVLIRISRQVKGEINYVKLEFIDNGLGIPEEKKQLIFQKKYRSGELKAGMGLGLSLVKNAIDSYGGEISIEDRVQGDYSQGSNFIILIPESI
jgi:signal transduction histidine kinase